MVTLRTIVALAMLACPVAADSASRLKGASTVQPERNVAVLKPHTQPVFLRRRSLLTHESALRGTNSVQKAVSLISNPDNSLMAQMRFKKYRGNKGALVWKNLKAFGTWFGKTKVATAVSSIVKWQKDHPYLTVVIKVGAMVVVSLAAPALVPVLAAAFSINAAAVGVANWKERYDKLPEHLTTAAKAYCMSWATATTAVAILGASGVTTVIPGEALGSLVKDFDMGNNWMAWTQDFTKWATEGLPNIFGDMGTWIKEHLANAISGENPVSGMTTNQEFNDAGHKSIEKATIAMEKMASTGLKNVVGFTAASTGEQLAAAKASEYAEDKAGNAANKGIDLGKKVVTAFKKGRAKDKDGNDNGRAAGALKKGELEAVPFRCQKDAAEGFPDPDKTSGAETTGASKSACLFDFDGYQPKKCFGNDLESDTNVNCCMKLMGKCPKDLPDCKQDAKTKIFSWKHPKDGAGLMRRHYYYIGATKGAPDSKDPRGEAVCDLDAKDGMTFDCDDFHTN